MNVEHEIEGGWVLIEGDLDLFGKVQSYRIKGTRYDVVRTPKGWRARITAHGNARRAFKSAPFNSAPEVVRYLAKWQGLANHASWK